MTRREFSRLAALAPLAPAAKPSTAATVKPLIVLPESNQIHEIDTVKRASLLAGSNPEVRGGWPNYRLSLAGRRLCTFISAPMNSSMFWKGCCRLGLTGTGSISLPER